MKIEISSAISGAAVQQRSGFTARAGLLLASAAVIALLLFSLTGCIRDPNVRAQKAYERAEKYLKENKPDAAAIELRRALQLNPQHAKAHYALGTIELQRGDLLRAFQEFVAASTDDPDDHQAQVMVAELLARSHNFTQSKRQAELILNRWIDDKTGTLLLAESEIGLQDYKRAQTLVNEVLAKDPNNARALQDLAILQIRGGELPQAQATLRRTWQLDPKSPLAPGLLSSTYENQKDLANAESVLKQALNQNPNQVEFQAMLAGFYMRYQRYADAEPIYKQIQAKSKDQSQYRDILALFYLHCNRVKDAQEQYKTLVQTDDKDWRSWHGLAVSYAMDKRSNEALEVLDRVLKDNPKDWESLALKGRILYDQGRAAEAIVALQQAHKLHPESAEPAFDLGRAYIAQGNLVDAQAALQDVVKVNSRYPGALFLLASLNLQRGRVDQAIQDLNQEQIQPSNTVDHTFLMGEALAAKGDYHSAEFQLENLLGNPGSSQKKLLILDSLSSIKLAQKQYAEAAKLATTALEASPRQAIALYSLGMSYVGLKQPDKGIEAVKSHLKSMPDWAQGYQVLGQVAQQAGKLSIAADAFQQALRIDPNLVSAQLSLGDTYFLNKQYDLAQQQYEQASQQKGSRSYAMARLGQIAEIRGDFKNAEGSYEKALVADQENVLAKNNLAWLYAEHGGNIDTALRLAEEAKEKAPEDPTITDTLGWIYVKKGSYEAAVANLKNSVAKNPHDPQGLYHLGTAYYRLGKTADARRELEAALKMPDFSQAADAKKMLADMSLK
jgi:tetratricopeptide (TPR) repeat protein